MSPIHRTVLAIVALCVAHLHPCRAGSASAVQSSFPCDSTLQLTISAQFVQGTTWEFQANVYGSGYTVNGLLWNFNDGTSVVASAYPQHAFPGAGTYLVCLTALASDLAGLPCEGIACLWVEVADPGCPGLQPEFSVSVNGPLVQFHDVGFSTDSIWGYAWDLGDGTTSTDPSPVHQYAGSGPYLVCMTITVGPPGQTPCSTTLCHWYYNGPVDPPCSLLVEASFSWQEINGLIAFLDASNTTGMTAVHEWDLGDGTTASGPDQVHAYAQPGQYNVCLTVTVSGPILTDSCVSTFCDWIWVGALATVPEEEKERTLVIHPNPSSSETWVEAPKGCSPCTMVVRDVAGREVMVMPVGPGPRTIPVGLPAGTPSGAYLVELRSDNVRWRGRLLRQ